MTKNKLRKILEERLTKTDTKLLLKGTFKPPSYSEGAFEAISNRLKKENLLEGIKVEQQNDVVMDIFGDLKKDLRKFKLGNSTDALNDAIDNLLSPGVEEARDLISQTIAPTGGAILEQRAVLPVSPALTTPVNNTIVNNQMATANTLGARYLGGINYNRMNTAQKADYADKVFKTTV